jgi:hypothetical protein
MVGILEYCSRSSFPSIDQPLQKFGIYKDPFCKLQFPPAVDEPFLTTGQLQPGKVLRFSSFQSVFVWSLPFFLKIVNQ